MTGSTEVNGNSPMAIVGMDARLGPARDLDAMARRLYDGEPLLPTAENDIDDALAHVIHGALADAGLEPDASVHTIIVAPKTESTPSTVSAAQSVFAALASASRKFAQSTSGLPQSIVIAAGNNKNAGAIVLQDLAQAEATSGVVQPPREMAQSPYGLAQSPRIYAVLESLVLAHEHGQLSPETIEATCRQAWAQTDLSQDALGYLELAGSDALEGETPTLTGLRNAYRRPPDEPELSCGLGTIAALNLPSTSPQEGPLHEIASLIKTILCLHRRFIPAQPGWQGPKAPERWQGTPFYVSIPSHPWFVDKGKRRVAALHSTMGDGYAHLILSDIAQTRRNSHTLKHAAYYLIPIAAGSRETLLAQLWDMQQHVIAASTQAQLRAVIQRSYESYQKQAGPRYTLCLAGAHKEDLLRDIDFAFEGVAEAFQTQQPWQTPRGSYFTPRPLAGKGNFTGNIVENVAFVYPGAFNAYPNLGRDLFQLFPDLHVDFAQWTSDIGGAMGERALYPRSLVPLSKAEQQTHERALIGQPATLIKSGTAFAILYTIILRDYFSVQPAATLGYSLGEASMLWATGVWQNADASRRAWRNSPLFKNRLSGAKQAVREAWDIGPAVDDDALWCTYLLKSPIDAIKARVAEEPRVDLTMINTAQEGIIAGDPAGCQRVIEALGCHALPVPYDAVIHSDVMRSEHPAFVALYSNPIQQRPTIAFYSTAGYEPLKLESNALAHALADMTCAPVDFPRLVQRAYEDGVRIFVELGPQHTCTRWIDKVLAGKPHAVMAINKKGTPDIAALIGVLAKLLSHGVDVDLSRLYAPERIAVLPSGENYTSPPLGEPALSLSKGIEGGKGLAAMNEFSLARRYYEGANAHMQQLADTHGTFLQARHAALQETSTLIKMQIATYERWLEKVTVIPHTNRLPPSNSPHGGEDYPSPPTGGNEGGEATRFDQAALQAFATGSAAQCFGPTYAVFEHRRMPRIPNGDLLLMSRIVDVEGKQGEIHPGASLLSAYDVPNDAWFYQQNAYPAMPYAILMETALQPCGFLSAYQGSALRYPETDFYFRNLDGTGNLLSMPDLQGRTITNRVEMLSSSTMRGVILQQFSFALALEQSAACEGEIFYEGQASFGYFEAAALSKQAGLDAGAPSLPWYHQMNIPASAIEVLDLGKDVVRQRYYTTTRAHPHYHLAGGQLDLLSRRRQEQPAGPFQSIRIVKGGGRYGRGYVHAEARVDPAAWFFACHFYEDPVMPGSLGVQAIQQALQVYAIHQDLGGHLHNPHFAQVMGHRTTWKYRGQIKPSDRALALEVHVKDVRESAGQVTLIGDASLWRGEQRIYEVNDTGICIKGG